MAFLLQLSTPFLFLYNWCFNYDIPWRVSFLVLSLWCIHASCIYMSMSFLNGYLKFSIPSSHQLTFFHISIFSLNLVCKSWIVFFILFSHEGFVELHSGVCFYPLELYLFHCIFFKCLEFFDHVYNFSFKYSALRLPFEKISTGLMVFWEDTLSGTFILFVIFFNSNVAWRFS